MLDLRKKSRVFMASRLKEFNGPGGVTRSLHRNLKQAQQLCLRAAQLGLAPYASHVFCPTFLDDRIPEERALGLAIGHAFIPACTALIVWPFDEISDGMRLDIKEAISNGLPIGVISCAQVDTWTLEDVLTVPEWHAEVAARHGVKVL